MNEEHDPSSKRFKRGDKVYSPARQLNGLVLGEDPTHKNHTLVHWGRQPWMGPAEWQMRIAEIESVLTERLEHDEEAPE